MEKRVLRKAIEQLRKELGEIQYAIHALEAVASGKRRRGRPPKFVTVRQAQGARRSRPKAAGAS